MWVKEPRNQDGKGVGDNSIRMEVEEEAEAKESQINISHFNSLPRANAFRDNQIVQNLDFTSHFYDIYLIFLPKELKTKINNS